MLFARHHALSNLVVLIDANGLQGFGNTREIASLEPLDQKVRGFGLEVDEIDGHDPAALDAALDRRTAGPKVVLLRTVKGHGVSFMEGRMEWHYLPLSDQQYAQAMSERTLA
jgi:transketolase